MNKMAEQNEQKKIIEKICNSQVFDKSTIAQNILTYLFQCTVQGTVPSEIDIANDVLGKGKQFDPLNDAAVRVYIYNLRKKLNNYYKNEGKNDSIRVKIPKGHYKVEFVNKKNDPELHESFNISKVHKYFITIPLTVIALLVILYGLFSLGSKNKFESYTYFKENSAIWSDILSKQFPTIITFERVFRFHCIYKYNKEVGRYLPMKENYSDDQKDLMASQLNANTTQGDIFPYWDLIPEVTILNLLDIQPLFLFNEKEYQIMWSSKIEWKHINSSDIIYLGNYDQLGKLSQFFPSFITVSDQNNKLFNRKISVKHSSIDSSYTYISPIFHQNLYTRDYVVLAKATGPQQNKILYIVSFHQIGRKEIVKCLTVPDKHETMMKKIQTQVNDPLKDFLVLFEVEGYRKAPYRKEIKHVISWIPK